MYRLIPILVLAGVFLAVSCKNSASDRFDIDFITDPEFTADLFEVRSPVDGAPEPGLWLESIDAYPCPGYRIEHKVTQNDRRLEVFLDGVAAPDTCPPQSATARAFIPLSALSDGDYQLTVYLGQSLSNTGVLHWEQGNMEWKLMNPAGIDLQNRVLRRIPDGLLWGYIDTRTEQQNMLADQFVGDLKQITGEANLAPAYYGYFTVTGTGLVFPHKSVAPDGAHQWFVRSYSGAERNSIKQLLDQYRGSTAAPLIWCLSTEGSF